MAIQHSRTLQAAGDLGGAVACLDAVKFADGFFPEAGLQLAMLKQAAKDWGGAKAMAAEVTRHAPHQKAAWTILLANRLPHAPFPGGTRPRWDDFLETLRREAAIDNPWLRTAFLEALLQARPGDWHSLATRAEADGLLRPGDLAALDRAMGFLAAIGAQIGPPGMTWSLGLEPWAEPCRIRDGAIRLNSGWFRNHDPDAGRDTILFSLLAREVAALLGPEHFRDAVDLSAPDWIDRRDFPATLAEMALLLALRDLAGLDRDIRDCPRPLPFAPGRLILRAGRCELWALTTWLLDPEAQARAAERVAVKAVETARTGGAFEDWTYHWPRLNPEETCNSLSCNAGWYARPGSAAPAFSDWAERYLAAMDAGLLLAECAEDLQRIAALRPASAAHPLHAWDNAAFARFLSGKDVVFVTAFAAEMQRHFDTGQLALLWRAADLPAPPRRLRTVAAPMSVWPYMPDQDWSVTFRRLVDQTAQAVPKAGHTVLLASCGCYGLPLVHALHQRLPGLSAIYNGHAMNSWFGILTNDALDGPLHRRAPDPALWQVVELAARYPGLSRIDEGRYVTDRVRPGPGRRF